MHRGETWLVRSLDLEEHVAVIDRAEPDYSTTAREITDIAIVEEREHAPWGACRLSFGEVDVTHQVVAFLRRRQPGGEVLGEEPLDLPERTLRTAAVWWTVPEHALAESGLAAGDLPGAAHAAEHCSIGLLPLFATCDRWDIGGVSTALHPDTGQLTVFVYDGHPGGAGFSERGFRTARAWLTATRDTIASCACEEGCPSCIQSPKCGNQNNPLDKAGAAALLDLLLGARGLGSATWSSVSCSSWSARSRSSRPSSRPTAPRRAARPRRHRARRCTSSASAAASRSSGASRISKWGTKRNLRQRREAKQLNDLSEKLDKREAERRHDDKSDDRRD